MRELGDTGAEPFWEGLVTADGVFAVDLQQRVVFWGPTVEGLTGRQTDQVLGKPCYEVVAGRDTRNHRFCRRNCPVIVNARRGARLRTMTSSARRSTGPKSGST
ncbi:MAG: hypothetical protein C4316_06980 [Chloroflexota bacterium]